MVIVDVVLMEPEIVVFETVLPLIVGRGVLDMPTVPVFVSEPVALRVPVVVSVPPVVLTTPGFEMVPPVELTNPPTEVPEIVPETVLPLMVAGDALSIAVLPPTVEIPEKLLPVTLTTLLPVGIEILAVLFAPKSMAQAVEQVTT